LAKSSKALAARRVAARTSSSLDSAKPASASRGRWIGTYHFSHVVPIVEVELVHQGVGRNSHDVVAAERRECQPLEVLATEGDVGGRED